jgi:2-oxoglutarate ferredoxin oxidoreductase subunit beta
LIQRLVAEVIDEMGIENETVGVGGIGCSSARFFDLDAIGGAHGRAPAIATGIKRCHPDKFVFTYQGDGDCTAIGCSEVIHAAGRGEKITVIMANNTNFAMTGGQMSPTTLIGQKTTTTPNGRDAEVNGLPLKMAEMLALQDGAKYVARVAVYNNAEAAKAKRAIRKAFEVQKSGEGFSFVEVLSACPTIWGMSPVEAVKRTEEEVAHFYPLGELKKPEEVAK